MSAAVGMRQVEITVDAISSNSEMKGRYLYVPTLWPSVRWAGDRWRNRCPPRAPHLSRPTWRSPGRWPARLTGSLAIDRAESYTNCFRMISCLLPLTFSAVSAVLWTDMQISDLNACPTQINSMKYAANSKQDFSTQWSVGSFYDFSCHHRWFLVFSDTSYALHFSFRAGYQ